jgi:excisionase family DNA binding protein
MNDLKAKTRLTMREAAEYLGHSYTWIHANHRVLGLGGYLIGGRWYFDREDLDSWLLRAKDGSRTRSYLPLRDSKKGRVRL